MTAIIEHAPGLDDVPAAPAIPPLDPNAVTAADADRARLNAFLRKALAEGSGGDDRPAIRFLRATWVAMASGMPEMDAYSAECWRLHIGHLEVEMGRTGSPLHLTPAPR